MKKLPSILLFGVLSVSAGCVRQSPSLSYDSLSGAHQSRQATELAQAVAERIGQRYPGQSVSIAKADTGVFGDALSYALTQTGSLGTENTSAVSLTYAMGEMDGSGYLHVRFSDGNAMAQSFPLAAPELAPELAMHETLASNSLLSPAVSRSAVDTTPLPSPDLSSLSSPALSIVAASSTAETVLGTPTRLSNGVLSSLPPSWRYTIPDSSRRAVRVSKPNLPWRESIQNMAEQAGCAASFDEAARRVTIIAYDDAPVPLESPATFAFIGQTAPAAGPLVPTAATGIYSPVVSTALAEVSLPSTPIASPIEPAASLSAVAAPSPPLSPALAEEWKLAPGSLADQLSSWCSRSGWTLIWKADSDVRLHVTAIMRGSFEKVVGELFKGLSVQGNSLRATLYHGNNVLEVREN